MNGQEQFHQSLQELKTEIEQLQEKDGIGPIYDGPLAPEDYLKSNLKILWIMKEPYGKEEGDADYAEWIKNDDFYNNAQNSLTWKTIAYISYGILYNKLWLDIPEMNKELFFELKKVAWINIQKIPRKDDWRTNNEEIALAYNTPQVKKIIQKQIDVCNPNIIICGRTFDIIRADFNCTYKGTVGTCDYYISNGKIILDVYHPAYWTIPREAYINDIVLAAETLQSKSKLSYLELLTQKVAKLADKMNLEINYFDNLGRADSCFYFSRPEWDDKNLAIGFGFDKFFNDFFYGICKRNFKRDIFSELRERIKNNFKEQCGEPTDVWPWWEWHKNKTWDKEVFNEIESGLFIDKIELIVKDLLEKIERV